MARKPWPSRVYPKATVYKAGPWVGMRDAIEPAAARPDLAKLLRNCYATSTSDGARCVQGIPGFSLAGTQLGTGGSRTIQWIGQFTTTTGTTKSLAFCNGTLSQYDWGANTWTTRLTVAQIAAGTGAPVISTSAKIYCVMFGDALIVSDGTNVPFKWDGTSGGGVVELSNCPILYGQPVVYYYKLSGRKVTEPDTIVWSEEGDPLLGYDTAPYENAWNLPGTRGEAITALAARNDSLGIIRPRSTTGITGAVATDFATSATRSSVSERIGTSSPGAALVLDEGTVIVDSDGKPQFWPRGGAYTASPALWDNCAQTVSGISRTQIVNAQIEYDEATNLIWIGLAGGGSSNLTQYLLFERTGGVPNLVGVAADFPSTRLGRWVDTDGVTHFMHGGVDDGYVYYHGDAVNGPWNFGFAATTSPISHELQPSEMGADIDEETNYDEFSVEVILNTNLTLSISYATPSGTSASAQAMTFTGSGSLWDVAVWDVDVWSSEVYNARKRNGIDMHGRWLRPSIAHSTLSEQFCIIGCQTVAFGEGRDPEID